MTTTVLKLRRQMLKKRNGQTGHATESEISLMYGENTQWIKFPFIWRKVMTLMSSYSGTVIRNLTILWSRLFTSSSISSAKLAPWEETRRNDIGVETRAQEVTEKVGTPPTVQTSRSETIHRRNINKYPEYMAQLLVVGQEGEKYSKTR